MLPGSLSGCMNAAGGRERPGAGLDAPPSSGAVVVRVLPPLLPRPAAHFHLIGKCE